MNAFGGRDPDSTLSIINPIRTISRVAWKIKSDLKCVRRRKKNLKERGDFLLKN